MSSARTFVIALSACTAALVIAVIGLGCSSQAALPVVYLVRDEPDLWSSYQYSDAPIYTARHVWSDWRATVPDASLELVADVAHVTTNLSAYDFQLASPLIAVEPHTSYRISIDLDIPNGGAGLHVLGAQGTLSSAYWCQADDLGTQSVLFDTADDTSVTLVLSNCGYPEAAISDFSIRSLDVWQVTNFSPQNSPLTPLIAEEYPEFLDESLTDWQKINILREWAYQHIDRAQNGLLLEDTSPRNVNSMSAPELFEAFFQDEGGASCGLTNLSLTRLYQHFGFEAYTVNSGNVGTTITHVAALVRVNYEGSDVLTLQDAYFNSGYVDDDGAPLDYFTMLAMIRHGDADSVHIITSQMPTYHDYLCNSGSECVSWYNHNLIWTDSDVCQLTSENLVVCESQTTYADFTEYYMAADLWFEFLASHDHPADLKYIFLYPFSINDGVNENLTLLERALSITREDVAA
ncbi:MAG: hypothetical protein H7175_17100 [Burkholderiales bacterium]|nr:hypothetical protein [Anaerolineae bacterium]